MPRRFRITSVIIAVAMIVSGLVAFVPSQSTSTEPLEAKTLSTPTTVTLINSSALGIELYMSPGGVSDGRLGIAHYDDTLADPMVYDDTLTTNCGGVTTQYYSGAPTGSYPGVSYFHLGIYDTNVMTFRDIGFQQYAGVYNFTANTTLLKLGNVMKIISNIHYNRDAIQPGRIKQTWGATGMDFGDHVSWVNISGTQGTLDKPTGYLVPFLTAGKGVAVWSDDGQVLILSTFTNAEGSPSLDQIRLSADQGASAGYLIMDGYSTAVTTGTINYWAGQLNAFHLDSPTASGIYDLITKVYNENHWAVTITTNASSSLQEGIQRLDPASYPFTFSLNRSGYFAFAIPVNGTAGAFKVTGPSFSMDATSKNAGYFLDPADNKTYFYWYAYHNAATTYTVNRNQAVYIGDVGPYLKIDNGRIWGSVAKTGYISGLETMVDIFTGDVSQGPGVSVADAGVGGDGQICTGGNFLKMNVSASVSSNYGIVNQNVSWSSGRTWNQTLVFTPSMPYFYESQLLHYLDTDSGANSPGGDSPSHSTNKTATATAQDYAGFYFSYNSTDVDDHVFIGDNSQVIADYVPTGAESRLIRGYSFARTGTWLLGLYLDPANVATMSFHDQGSVPNGYPWFGWYWGTTNQTIRKYDSEMSVVGFFTDIASANSTYDSLKVNGSWESLWGDGHHYAFSTLPILSTTSTTIGAIGNGSYRMDIYGGSEVWGTSASNNLTASKNFVMGTRTTEGAFSLQAQSIDIVRSGGNYMNTTVTANDILTGFSWTTHSDATSISFTLSGLDSGKWYRVKVDGETVTNLRATSGSISFTYSGPWSEHQFEVSLLPLESSIHPLKRLVSWSIGFVLLLVMINFAVMAYNEEFEYEDFIRLVVFLLVGLSLFVVVNRFLG